MTAKLLPAAKCSQMDNPVYGTGTGGDRCTEAVGAMIDCTYKIGPEAQQGVDPEKIMYQFTEMLNNGRDVSALEDASWISAWVKQHSNGQITIGDLRGATFADIKACVDRGHLAILGVHDYSLLKAYDGSDPYQWNPANEHVGHVLLLVGYNDDMVDSQGRHWGQTIVVHDPLRGTRGQPWDYSWASFQAARLDDLMEVSGPPLGAPAVVVPMDSHFTQKDANTWQCITNGFVVTGALYHQMVGALTHPEGFWLIFGLPLENAHLDSDGYLRQGFERVVARINPNNPNDFANDPRPLTLQAQLDAANSKIAQLEAQIKQLTSAQPLDLAGLKADVASLEAQLAPVEAQVASLQAVEQTVKDIEKKLGN